MSDKDFNWKEQGMMSDNELDEIDENLRRAEQEGVRNILKYFDRIHDKLFTFNNIIIASYLALSKIFNSISIYGIIFPFVNMGFLLFIEYRMMEKSRFESNVRTKTPEEIKKHGLSLDITNIYSLLIIFSTLLVIGIFVYNLFSFNPNSLLDKNLQKNQSAIDKIEPFDSVKEFILVSDSIIGAWTDNETENATLAFDKDSVVYVDQLKYFKYQTINDTLLRYFDELVDTSIIIKVTKDSLILRSKYGLEKYKRFIN